MTDLELVTHLLNGAKRRLVVYQGEVKNRETGTQLEEIKKSNDIFNLSTQIMRLEEIIAVLGAMDREDQEEEKESVCESCRIRPMDKGQEEK